mgnify:CR=1 FL=1
MKKLMRIAAVVSLLVFFLTGIIGFSESAGAKSFTIGVSLASDVNPFYIAMGKGMRMQAKAMGAKLRFVTANEDMAAQLNGVQDLIAAGVDILLISPIDAVASGAALDAAAAA